jgi:hypothetical protein
MLRNMVQNLESWVRVRCSMKGDEDVVYHFKGIIHKWEPQGADATSPRRSTPLFGIDGFNIARCNKIKEGNTITAFQMYSRELVFYTDLNTGEVLDSWTNSKGQRVEVRSPSNGTVVTDCSGK